MNIKQSSIHHITGVFHVVSVPLLPWGVVLVRIIVGLFVWFELVGLGTDRDAYNWGLNSGTVIVGGLTLI